MRKGFLIMMSLLILSLMTSCVNYLINRIKGIKVYAVPPITQVFFQVDTFYLDNPVLISDKYLTWLVDARDSVFNDKLAESYVKDSVRYVWGKNYSFVSPLVELGKMEKYTLTCRCSIELEQNGMKKYKVFRFIQHPTSFILCLVNTAYYFDKVQSIDNPITFWSIVKDETTTYLPIAYPLGCCDDQDLGLYLPKCSDTVECCDR